jgi:hypothetical protein
MRGRRVTPGDDFDEFVLGMRRKPERSSPATATAPTDWSPPCSTRTATRHAARDQINHAAGVITDTTVDLVGNIGRHVLANLMPDRRVRTKPEQSNARTPNT